MKLIMENWRRYIQEESVIKLPQSVYELENQKPLDEENLNESQTDSDPQSYSLAELKNIAENNPDEIREAYRDMMSKESTSKGPRAQAYQGLDLKHRNLKRIWTKRVAEDGLLTYLFDKAKEISNRILNTDYETVDSMRIELNAIQKEINDLTYKDFTPLQREIIRAIFHFTDLKVPVVRKPDRFMKGMASLVDYYNDGIRMTFLPSRETYEKAKIILEVLYSTPLQDAPDLWRGLDIAIKGSEKYSGLEDYKVGAVIDAGNIVSFSLSSEVAKRFAGITTGVDNIPERFPVLLNIPKGNLLRGVDVDEYSGYEGTEKEIIVGGKFTIQKIRAISKRGKTLAIANSAAQLWEKLGWGEQWKMAYKSPAPDLADLESKYFRSKTNPRKAIIIITLKQKGLTNNEK